MSNQQVSPVVGAKVIRRHYVDGKEFIQNAIILDYAWTRQDTYNATPTLLLRLDDGRVVTAFCDEIRMEEVPAGIQMLEKLMKQLDAEF